jgi:hypothetical protein
MGFNKRFLRKAEQEAGGIKFMRIFEMSIWCLLEFSVFGTYNNYFIARANIICFRVIIFIAMSLSGFVDEFIQTIFWLSCSINKTLPTPSAI